MDFVVRVFGFLVVFGWMDGWSWNLFIYLFVCLFVGLLVWFGLVLILSRSCSFSLLSFFLSFSRSIPKLMFEALTCSLTFLCCYSLLISYLYLSLL